MKITCTNGNRRNKISGSRITVATDKGEIIDRFEVPKRNGVKYCNDYPLGAYGQRLIAAEVQAKKMDKAGKTTVEIIAENLKTVNN